jgi:hypothetical protein
LAILNASEAYLTETYLHQWVKTIGAHISVDVAWGTGPDPFRRMRIICNKCRQTLTCDVPETPEKIDWAMQKFAGLHRHDPELKPIIKVQLAPIPLTADFKPAKLKSRAPKEGRKFRETN